MSEHTKGPWTTQQRYSDTLSVVDSDGYEIVTAENTAILLGYREKLGIDHWGSDARAVRDLSFEEQAANARLIAAAPDQNAALLDAPEPVRLSTHRESQLFHQRYAIWYDNQRRAAIAKAAGR